MKRLVALFLVVVLVLVVLALVVVLVLVLDLVVVLVVVLDFVVLDYVTGIMCAVTDHKLSSAVGFKGIFRKILVFALVGVGHLLDVQVLGAVGVLRTAVIFFYLSNEGVSLIENAAHLGLPIPAKLKAVLEQLHDRAEKDGENDEQAE